MISEICMNVIQLVLAYKVGNKNKNLNSDSNSVKFSTFSILEWFLCVPKFGI